jgi:hypothetical protein
METEERKKVRREGEKVFHFCHFKNSESDSEIKNEKKEPVYLALKN